MMEFDKSGCNTNLDAMKTQYINAGYKIPNLIFWNVNGRVGNVPAKATDKGVALVSGASPAIVKSVLEGKDMTPRGVMMQTLQSDRYSAINVE